MNPAGDGGPLLRPLTLGEVFDRAITLYVRNLVPFTFIALVAVVPLAVLHYFAGLHSSQALSQLLDVMRDPRGAAAPVQSAADQTFAFLSIAASVFFGAFVSVAVAVATSRLYQNEPIEWARSYARALVRAPGVVLTLLCEVLVLFFVLLAGAIAMGLFFALAIMLVRSSVALAIVLFVLTAIVLAAWIVGSVLSYLAFAFAYNAIGVENISSWRAVGSGFARIFNRAELLRACLLSLALCAIYLGVAFVSVSVAAIFEVMHLHILNVAVNALINLVTMPFLGVLLAVYYFDVRVRREALDLQTQITALEPAAPAS